MNNRFDKLTKVFDIAPVIGFLFIIAIIFLGVVIPSPQALKFLTDNLASSIVLISVLLLANKFTKAPSTIIPQFNIIYLTVLAACSLIFLARILDLDAIGEQVLLGLSTELIGAVLTFILLEKLIGWFVSPPSSETPNNMLSPEEIELVREQLRAGTSIKLQQINELITKWEKLSVVALNKIEHSDPLKRQQYQGGYESLKLATDELKTIMRKKT